MSGVIVKVRKARKDYQCPSVWAHDPVIRKGDSYARVKVPPYTPGDQWAEVAYHIECAEEWDS